MPLAASWLSGGVQGLVEVVVGVGEGDHAGLEARGRQEDALLAHLLVEGGEQLLVALFGGGEVHHFLLAEVGAEHGGDGGHLDGHALGAEDGAQFAGKGGHAAFEGIVVHLAQLAQGGQTGGHGQRVAGKGTGLIDGAARSHVFHVLALAAEGAHGQAAADDLAEGGQVGIDAEAGLGAAEGGAEAGDDFVEDEQGAVLAGDLAQAFEEAGLGQDEAHVGGHGFDDDGGDAFAMLAEDLAHGLKVVVGGQQGVVREFILGKQ